MSRSRFVLVATLLVLSARLLSGQMGELDDRTQYTLLTGPSHRGTTHGALQAVVLWRGEPGWNQAGNPAERQRLDSIHRVERLRADAAGDNLFGGVMFYGVQAGDGRSVTIEGKRFDLPQRDSALVIMVTVPPSGQARTVSATFLTADLPAEYWASVSRRGDTTRIVEPDFRRKNAMLMSVLTQSPVVASFLR